MRQTVFSPPRGLGARRQIEMWTGCRKSPRFGPKNMKKHDLRGRLVYKRKSSARRFCAAAEI
jgi:hypothetical protein